MHACTYARDTCPGCISESACVDDTVYCRWRGSGCADGVIGDVDMSRGTTLGAPAGGQTTALIEVYMHTMLVYDIRTSITLRMHACTYR